MKNTARQDVFAVTKYLDERLSAKAFSEVDQFLLDLDMSEVASAAYLLAICNYVRMAHERGDLLVQGVAFRERARTRMCELVGEERTDKLMRFR